MENQLYFYVASLIGKYIYIWIKSFPKHIFVNSASKATSDLLVHENKCTKWKQSKISEIT
jgi:hypothetical protein